MIQPPVGEEEEGWTIDQCPLIFVKGVSDEWAKAGLRAGRDIGEAFAIQNMIITIQRFS